MKARHLGPLLLFVGLGVALLAGLQRDPRELPSALLGKPLPVLELPALDDGAAPFASAGMRGRPWLLNVWASWCTPCQLEHPLLVRLARDQGAPLVGLNYKDSPEAARAWLRRLGNPFVANAADADGRAGIDLGVYGVPETFVIDRAGRVRLRHAGPLTEQVLRDQLMPLLRRLEQEGPGDA
ncbi:DsbE family thiol:disulfide interchange protein [Variovorax sp.]|uniref:DsbE family thiol:disulfide interchange protein n=1 Tax=Variovorax sp. TaxID=1871043 RepID=UPI002D3AC784|nr:DsbE family thiol:disulfide interchange protein [Variovorax sp.]HYP83105.1 DsbE family thiol:disulfide interchange protein [Variovorax sp.]